VRGISSEGINKVPYSKTFSFSQGSTCTYKQMKLGTYFPNILHGIHTLFNHTHTHTHT